MKQEIFLKAMADAACARGLTNVSPSMLESLIHFHGVMASENDIQNLTRLISRDEFIEGHLIDCFELSKREWIANEMVVDLGSGCGVPGIPMAILNPTSKWALVESERRKADFLKNVTRSLELLDRVSVLGERFEDIDSVGFRPETVVCRAVGPVLRIFGWIKNCSTWNTLVLFKGPSWVDEWADFQRSSNRKRLKIAEEYSYFTTPSMKKRTLIKLMRF